MWGIDRVSVESNHPFAKRIASGVTAMLTHSPAVDRFGRHSLGTIEHLAQRLELVLSPEHGFLSTAQAEEPVLNESALAEPSYRQNSLYGLTRESLSPKAEDLAGIDTLVIDLCDVGSRYYTYIWTGLLAARAAAAQGVHTVVLDRPNPLSGDPSRALGKLQSVDFLSFVGLEPLPIRHCLTIGEIIAGFMSRDGHALGGDGAVSVVSSQGWERHRSAAAWGRPFVPPSPNMPSLETAVLYPGGCLLEGTNLSEGRGTSFPFRAVGAPFLDGERLAASLRALELPGLFVRPNAFIPSFEKHSGKQCSGVMLHVTDELRFDPLRTYLSLIVAAKEQAPEEFQFLDRVYEFEAERPAFDLLTGSAEARDAILAGASADETARLIESVGPEHRQLVHDWEQLALDAN